MVSGTGEDCQEQHIKCKFKVKNLKKNLEGLKERIIIKALSCSTKWSISPVVGLNWEVEVTTIVEGIDEE